MTPGSWSLDRIQPSFQYSHNIFYAFRETLGKHSRKIDNDDPHFFFFHISPYLGKNKLIHVMYHTAPFCKIILIGTN